MSYKTRVTYLIMENVGDNLFKIGRSHDVEGRFKSLLVGNTHIELIGVSTKGENELHKEFSEFKVRGEWFDFSNCNKTKNRLLSYFIEFNKENVNEVINEVKKIRPEDTVFSDGYNERFLRQQERFGSSTQHNEPQPLSGRAASNAAYHNIMKYGGGRW